MGSTGLRNKGAIAPFPILSARQMVPPHGVDTSPRLQSPRRRGFTGRGVRSTFAKPLILTQGRHLRARCRHGRRKCDKSFAITHPVT